MAGTLIIGEITATAKGTIDSINAEEPKTIQMPASILKKWLVELRSLRKEKKNQAKYKKAYK